MHCVKLLGQRLMARDFDRQVAEFQVRVAVLNVFTGVGIPITKVIGGLSGRRGSPAVSRFVQQSLAEVEENGIQNHHLRVVYALEINNRSDPPACFA